jgi:hypothetical protein
VDSQVQPLPLGSRIEELEITQVVGADAAGYDYAAIEVTSRKTFTVREFAPAALVLRGEDRRILLRDEQDRVAFNTGLKQIFALAPLVKVKNPGLQTLVRIIETNGTTYAVYEPLAGELLSAVLQRQTVFDEPRLKSILLPLADGLEAAHEVGVLHLGIRPETILLRANGAPVLVGFGARTAPSPASPARGYRALERNATELRIGRWTDIYSLGAVAYALLAGRPPPEAAARALNDTMKPAQEIGADKYHRSLLQAIDWALTIHPLERPQNLAQWKDALLGLSEPVGRASAAGATVPITATMIRKFSDLRSGSTKETPAPVSAPATPPAAAARKTAAATAAPMLKPRATPPPAVASPPPSARPRGRSPWLIGGALLVTLSIAALLVLPETQSPAPAGEPAASKFEAPAPSAITEPAAAAEASPVATPSTAATPLPDAVAVATAATPPTSEVVLKSTRPRPRRTGEFREMQQELTAGLLPKLKGQWSMESTVAESLKDGACPASVTRIWVLTFTGSANDGQEIAGRFKSSFAAEGGESCRELRHLNNALGDLVAEPASPTAIRLLPTKITCSGDCTSVGTTAFFLPDESYRFSISERGDKLILQDEGRRFVLTRLPVR